MVSTIAGTKVKGTSTLEVEDSTVYKVGTLASIIYENETDRTRIQAGTAPPVWSSGGFPGIRRVLVRITVVPDASHITVDPPLPGDATRLELQVATPPSDNRTDGWGFEKFSVTFDATRHPTSFAQITMGIGTWFHNLDFENFARTSANGSCIKMTTMHKAPSTAMIPLDLPGKVAEATAFLPPHTLTPLKRGGEPSIRATPRLTRPSEFVPPNPPPSPQCTRI